MGYRYGIWVNGMGNDNIDMVILDIDMGYIVTLSAPPYPVVQVDDAAAILALAPHGVAAQVEIESKV